MRIRVKLFAALRDLASDETVEVHLPENATVGELRRTLSAQIPPAHTLLQQSRIAVNHDLAENDCPLTATDEIAVIPPVSGG